MDSELNLPLTVAERERRIFGALVALAKKFGPGFEASYDSISETASVEAHHVATLFKEIKDQFINVKLAEKGYGPANKLLRRITMFYPNRDARWYIMMNTLDFKVFTFADQREMLDNSIDEIEKAYCLHAQDIARASDTLQAPRRRRASRRRSVNAFDDYDGERNEGYADYYAFLERLERIEALLRQLVKARAFQDRVIPFEDDEDEDD